MWISAALPIPAFSGFLIYGGKCRFDGKICHATSFCKLCFTVYLDTSRDLARFIGPDCSHQIQTSATSGGRGNFIFLMTVIWFYFCQLIFVILTCAFVSGMTWSALGMHCIRYMLKAQFNTLIQAKLSPTFCLIKIAVHGSVQVLVWDCMFLYIFWDISKSVSKIIFLCLSLSLLVRLVI